MLPTYYTRLRPFAAWFENGWPILTYHKVGPRPWGARLRGLYVSARLFRSQVLELKRAGFNARSLDQFPPPTDTSERSIALTFDDGFTNIFDHALPTLAQAHWGATVFLVSDRIGGRNDWEMAEGERPERLMEIAHVREWLASGNEIGSHTRTHPWLTRLSPAQAREEITTSKKQLEDLFGRPIRHFCYPYGDCNERVVDLVREAGYATACTTRGGLNVNTTSAFELLRMTVRYRSRSLKGIKDWFAAWP